MTARDADTYLSVAEIRRLTGKVYAKVQVRVLAERGWAFTIDGDGLPLVLRAYHDQQLGMAPTIVRARRPRLAGLSNRSA